MSLLLRGAGGQARRDFSGAGLVGVHTPAIGAECGRNGHVEAGFALGRSASAGKSRGSEGVRVVILAFTAGCRMLTWGVA
jgi:hypothetical protein